MRRFYSSWVTLLAIAFVGLISLTTWVASLMYPTEDGDWLIINFGVILLLYWALAEGLFRRLLQYLKPVVNPEQAGTFFGTLGVGGLFGFFSPVGAISFLHQLIQWSQGDRWHHLLAQSCLFMGLGVAGIGIGGYSLGAFFLREWATARQRAPLLLARLGR